MKTDEKAVVDMSKLPPSKKPAARILIDSVKSGMKGLPVDGPEPISKVSRGGVTVYFDDEHTTILGIKDL
jgi:hypothetical protein